jgi:glyoxylase-like metal-dependent hydrolase (beta-lactamase superfamily II)
MALVVERHVVTQAQSNCYVVRAERGAPEAAVIDPGGGAAELRLDLARAGARATAILVTHGDYDHVGAVAELAEGTGAKVYFPDGEQERMEINRQWAVSIPEFEIDVLLHGDETFEAAGIEWQTVAIPGHSPAHVAFYADDSLFSGDLVFAGGVGRTDLPGGDWDTLVASVRTLADRFPPETRIYPGHGPDTTLGAELERNPFLAELRAS